MEDDIFSTRLGDCDYCENCSTPIGYEEHTCSKKCASVLSKRDKDAEIKAENKWEKSRNSSPFKWEDIGFAVDHWYYSNH